ncbi:MAG: hypothetical protein AB7I30_12095, partial [Isosphaeraceae bacterium]
MSRPRAAQLTATISATLVLGLMAAVSVLSHEQDEPPGTAGAGSSAGPGRSRPVPMPPGLVTLELRLGLGSAQGATAEYEGEISVSEGRVLTLDVVRGQATGGERPGRFRVGPPPIAANAKAKAKAKANQNPNAKKKQTAKQTTKKKAQAGANGPVILVGLDAPETASVTL